ncbi:YqaJ viral recombinase family protein [Cupriavidus gilardii]|uniref:YqaJ viral recombinase family protein n=1 Tax=Cupriavidus gilardii TaxID=82541 RepID=A0ABY4VPU4_9BURK|nr:YqaJ viral recombinase family protein [Cupriavidus gilardii]USE79023.1 YqaJ viral recombinase family protein [Cupriavidus gilardii]
MQIQNLVQGTAEWQNFRLQYCGASEAAAMLGLSPYIKRTELLHMKYTGTPKEFSDFVQERILDRGHEVEALARPLIEEDIGEDLYPVTCSDGKLSASCDGLTMDGETAFEHKQWNEELAALVADGHVPDSHMPQCQQILMVTGAKRVIFVVSDGTRDRMVRTEVTPDTAWFDRIRAGWEQFEKDLAEYEPQPVEVKPIGRTPETLPALLVEVTGHVTASNLTEFRDHAVAVFRSINRDLSTDQDFADAEKTVKWCGEVESRLAAAKQHALSQTASIDALFRAIDDISAEARRVRLDLDKLVTQRKTEIRESIIRGGREAYEKHVRALHAETGGAWVQLGMPDFAGAAKGKRSVASIQDAVDTVLANAKIEADASAKRIRTNIAFLDKAIEGYEFLFADRTALATKQLDDLRLVVTTRIDKHKADEEKRLEEQRARIRAEEAAKAQQAAAPQAAAAPAPIPASASPASASLGGRRVAALVPPMPSRPRPCPRPDDAEIVRALCSHFEATEAEVIGWLCELDFSTFNHAA